MLKRPRWCEESPLNISELGSPTLVWDFVKRLLVPPHPQNRTYHYFSRNLWCGKRTGPRQCLNWGCISAPSLWYLLCTLILPTSSPYTCLWVIGRAGIHPKPAFWPCSLSLSPSLTSSHSGWRISTKFLAVLTLSVSSTCSTGSSVSCETARRLHCKRITILQGAKGSVPVG